MKAPQDAKGKVRDLLLADIRVPAMLLSFVLSLWVVHLQQNINLDGILYMRAAHRILEGDWQGAYGLYKWLFYPSLIAMVSKISGLGLEGAAHFLNACFAGLLSYTFISLVQEINGSRKIIVAAALLIVFYPELNEYSYKVIRGHGYWPFYLLSLLCFIRFFKAPRWRYAIFWNISMIVATLFRIEGLVFVALLPLVLFLQRDCPFVQRTKNFLMAHAVNLAILASFLIVQAINRDLLLSRTGRLTDPLGSFRALWQEITVGIFAKADIVSSMLLNQYSDNYATIIVFLIPVVIFIGKIIDVLSPLLFCLFLLVPFVKSIDLKNKGVLVLLWAVVINLVIVFTFLFPKFFLQGRYVVGLALTLLAFLPFVFVFLYEKWRLLAKEESKKVWLYYLLALLLLVNSAEAVVSIPGSSTKKYIKDAGLWMKENIPVTANVYSNNNKVLFYSSHIYRQNHGTLPGRKEMDGEWLESFQIDNYDYLALWVRSGRSLSQEEIVAAVGKQPLRVFENKREDKILVFKGK